nr:bifunctional diaminohydroxyphosphoribosylaminopyrimidine deaminase/5-amino-6-(5-phosphoribosylamino)uracil reductase RibD [Halomicronema hongdechloris]
MTAEWGDEAWMRRCLVLAGQMAGKTAPNPLVGAVVVREGQLVGEGAHPGAGHPHAEVFALQAAADQARRATLYVNLEPCNHYGRTPPCTEAILQAGIARVVVGMVDPDERVSGQGIERLRQAGVEVTVGVAEADCQKINEAFVHRCVYRRPFGIFKYAMTLDGKIATSTGHSQWISGLAARTEVHRLRASCDAVIVGGNTVRRDDPLLTSHGVCDRNPCRIIMSRQLNLPETAQLWDVTPAPTQVFTQADVPPERQQALMERGVEVIALPRLTPATVMATLYGRGYLSVLWECGGTLAAQAIADGSIQKIWAFVAAKVIGGQTAPGPIGDLGIDHMTQAIALKSFSWHAVGSDLLLEGYLPNTLPQK